MHAEPQPRLLGALVDGRYRVERAVGAGGFGTVYSAHHVGLDAPVALKVVNVPERRGGQRLAQLVGRFLEEARTLKRLRHPNIVAALDVGLLPASDDGVQLPYLVMEWCSGPTLRELLEERGRLSVPEAWRLFEPLLDAIAHAHEAGIAHRDIKPANVLVDRDADGTLRPRVIDFGVAKMVAPEEAAGSGATSTASGPSPFTPRYAAPEQLAGARTGPWTDVYALALVFVEMVLGRAPIGSDGDAPLAVFEAERPTPSRFGVDVGSLEPVLARALALRPADRWADAAALRDAMRAAAATGFDDLDDAKVALRTDAPVTTTDPPVSAHADRTAPPSSRTLRTTSPSTGARVAREALATDAPRRAERSSRLRLFAAAAACLVALGSAAGAQRARQGWPFQQPLRDLGSDEIERRANALGLGKCTAQLGPTDVNVGCEQGFVAFLLLSHVEAQPSFVRTQTEAIAKSQRSLYGAVRFAVDGRRALVVGAAPDRVQAVFDGIVAGTVFDSAGSIAPAPTTRTEASFAALSAWTGPDLVAAVKATGVVVTLASPDINPATASFREGDAMAMAMLYKLDAHTTFETAMGPWRKLQLGYARDGDVLLVVYGDPAYASADYVRRLLAGARAQEVATSAAP